MKRQELIHHVESHGCRLLREGGKHSVYFNPTNNQTTAIPRHREINGYRGR
jgi:predicted RNA binding protein YcfA (HicA-like mRNA interferase family)